MESEDTAKIPKVHKSHCGKLTPHPSPTQLPLSPNKTVRFSIPGTFEVLIHQNNRLCPYRRSVSKNITRLYFRTPIRERRPPSEGPGHASALPRMLGPPRIKTPTVMGLYGTVS